MLVRGRRCPRFNCEDCSAGTCWQEWHDTGNAHTTELDSETYFVYNMEVRHALTYIQNVSKEGGWGLRVKKEMSEEETAEEENLDGYENEDEENLNGYEDAALEDGPEEKEEILSGHADDEDEDDEDGEDEDAEASAEPANVQVKKTCLPKAWRKTWGKFTTWFFFTGFLESGNERCIYNGKAWVHIDDVVEAARWSTNKKVERVHKELALTTLRASEGRWLIWGDWISRLNKVEKRRRPQRSQTGAGEQSRAFKKRRSTW